MKAEKTHQGLIEGTMLIFEGIIYFHIKNRAIKIYRFEIFFAGVESFTPDKLKPAKTREPASGVDGNYIHNIKSPIIYVLHINFSPNHFSHENRNGPFCFKRGCGKI